MASKSVTSVTSVTSQSRQNPQLSKQDGSVLDLAFAMDCTGSMGSYIAAATESIRQIVEEIVGLEKSDIKLALVEYRDHPPQESTFVTRVHDFTGSVKEMKKWLEDCAAVGGGDEPEAVADALQDVYKLSWREKSTKICVLISDAPPHGLTPNGDTFPNGSPNGIDPLKVARKMGEKGITLYSVGCEPSLIPYKEFFSALAYMTGGQYVPLRNAKLLAKVIVGGAVEEISLEKLMADVDKEVKYYTSRGVTNEKEIATVVQKTLTSKGVMTNQLKLNNTNLERASGRAVTYSTMSSMADLKKAYVKFVPESSGSTGSHTYRMPTSSMPMSGERHTDSSFAPSSYAADSYSVAHDTINMEQSERLVKKALNRTKQH